MTFYVHSQAQSIDSQVDKLVSWIFRSKYRRMISLVLLCYLSLYMYILLKNNITILVVPITLLMAVFLVTLTDCRITIELIRDHDLPVEMPADESDDEEQGEQEVETEEESKESEESTQPGFPVEQAPEPPATQWTAERLAEMD